MKKNLLKFLSVLAISVLLSFSAVAQEDRDERIASAAGDVYVISAKAGGVNVVEGKVAVDRTNGTSGMLLRGDNLKIGEKVSTGTDGKAEILLNPGSYLRLGSDSEFLLNTTDLEDLKITLNRGSAIFEVFASNEFKVEVQTPKSRIFLVESGIYRIDVGAANETISVWKGKARFGDDDANAVKGGKRAVIVGGQAAVEKFDRDVRDELDNWSRLRAKDIAKANQKLEKNTLRNSLLNSYHRDGWGFNDSFGLWVYNSFYGTYCFMPFGYGWRSPYGYGYSYNSWFYNYPWYKYARPQGIPMPERPNSPSPNPNPTVRPDSPGTDRAGRAQSPPFRRMEGERRIMPTFDDQGSGFEPMTMPTRTVTPTRSAPAQSAPTRGPIPMPSGGRTKGN